MSANEKNFIQRQSGYSKTLILLNQREQESKANSEEFCCLHMKLRHSAATFYKFHSQNYQDKKAIPCGTSSKFRFVTIRLSQRSKQIT